MKQNEIPGGGVPLSRLEKLALRRCGITAADLERRGYNCCGAVWGLLNGWYLVEMTFDGYDRGYIYRTLARRFLERAGLYNA